MLALTIGLLPGASLGAGRYRIRTDKVTSGMTLLRIEDRRGPNRIKVLKVDPRSALTIDVALATDVLPGHETTSSMAARHNAIAAINGDYTIRPYTEGSGRPVDTFAEDGVLKASPLIWGRNFSISRDETSVEIAHSELHVTLTQRDTGAVWTLDSVNGLQPARRGMSLYTPDGGETFKPPPAACAARLKPYGTTAWTSGQTGIADEYFVERMRCNNKPMKRRGGSVVAAPVGTEAAMHIRSHLVANEVVTLGWSMGRRGVLDTIGGNPNLVENGKIAADRCSDSYFCYRNPRTGIGVDGKGMLLLVTVDGRRSSSVGMTPTEFAEFFRYLGATWALNLDGGGSTTMVVRGRVINNVSDPYERPVGSAILVLQGPDPGEAEPVPQPTPSPSDGILGPVDFDPPSGGISDLPRTYCLAAADPASTGGMLDALARGDLGTHGRVPSTLMPALREYRSASSC